MHERSTTQPDFFHSPLSQTSPSLTCFTHLRWDFVWQRPQHLLSRAARHYRVLVIEEPLFRPQIIPHMAVNQRAAGVTVAVPMLPEGLDATDVVLLQRELIGKLIGRETQRARVFWYYTPMALAFSSELECDLCIYDNMDELSLFRGASHELLTLEDALFARTDLVFVGGMSLYEAKRERHHSVHAFPSSIDFGHFVSARTAMREVGHHAGIPGPRLGFFGVIDERMDVELISKLAELRPDWRFVMIGPVVKIDPATLPRRDNIQWLGSKTYSELPQYLSGWDVGIMPFALNEATRFISPTKTPEFLAAGVPVVSTPIADVVRPYGEGGLVEIATTPPEFARKCEILMNREKAPWLQKVDRFLAHQSWDQTWAAMHKLMTAALGDDNIERSTALPTYAIPAE